MNPSKVGTPAPIRMRIGLLAKLSLFLVALSLPVLLLVEVIVVGYEYHSLTRLVDRGALLEATKAEAGRLQELASRSRRVDMEHELDYWLLKLKQPGGLLGREASYVLQELSDQPFAAVLVDRLGQVHAQSPTSGEWSIDLSRIPVALIGIEQARSLETIETEDYVRLLAAPVGVPASGKWLILELRLVPPWRKIVRNLSFEWPVIMICLFLIGTGAACFLSFSVTRRLRRMQQAAGAWAGGDFSPRIADPSRDELGQMGGALDQMAIRLRELVRSRAAFARMAERDRVARDLHDTVKQQAFALHLKLAAIAAQIGCESESLRTSFNAASQLVHDIQRELADIMDELQSERDYKLPLPEQLRAQVEHWSQLNGIEAVLEASDLQLSEGFREELQRLVDEALANVLRHSGASRVEVRLQRDGARARLTISDDGSGFVQGVRRGMGLDSMETRAKNLPDGHFVLETALGVGTQVVISWAELWS